MSAPEGAPRRVLAGIDEAGLGPVLGPLAIGWSVFSAPPAVKSLWRKLPRTVSKNPARDEERVIVADSKLVFARNPRGAKRLETTALVFDSLLRPGRKPAASAAEFVFGPLRPAPEILARHPWYALLAPRLPLSSEAEALELKAERVWREMRSEELALLDAGVRIVPAGELNASYRLTGNKHTTVWSKLALVLRHVWERFGAEDLALVVDRQGGRVHYAAPLLRTFPEADVRELEVRTEWAEYELVERNGPRRMHVLFAERAEHGSLPVALASCFAKYARELCMQAFNAHFERLAPELRPTAGYTTDGLRWLRDAEAAIARAALDSDVLVRER